MTADDVRTLQRLQFSIDINAPRGRVWDVLWNDATYRDWTSAFSASSYAVSDWDQGSRIQFLDGSGSGMVALIETKRPPEFMSFRHIAEIKDGQEQPPAGWTGAHENYTLTERGSGTLLTVDLDAPAEYREMFDAAFPKALQRVKTLAEAK
jgi:uncharacterized protein YndB with AHSA1/START domain